MKIPKILKKWWFWTIVVVVILIAGFMLFSKGEEVSYVTEIVGATSLTQTVDSSGEVISIDEVDLSFDLSGTLEQVLVSVGDIVEPDTLLAVLDSTELIANVQSAYQAVQVAQANLELMRAGSTGEAIDIASSSVLIYQAMLDSANIDYGTAEALLPLIETRYDADVDAARVAHESAQDNYDQTTVSNSQTLSDAYGDLLSSAWAGVIEARSGLATADEVLGVRAGYSNDDYETVLSATNKQAYTNAKSAFYTAEETRDAAEVAIANLTYNSSQSAIYSAAVLAESAVNDVARVLLYTRQVIDATPISGAFTATVRSGVATGIDTARAYIQADQAALENSFQTLETAIDTTNAALEDASNVLTQAQSSYTSAQAVRDYQVITATQNLSSAQAAIAIRTAELAQSNANLAQTSADPREVDLASYEAEVARSQAAYSSALARLDNAEIRSPISGRVTDIAYDVGEQVVGAAPVIVVQTTDEQFEIRANISESDITKVKLDDTVLITFDAFGDDVEFEAFVGKIDPAEKLVDGVVYYEITVYLDNAENALSLRPGLSADLEILTDSRNSVLSLPQRAVLEDEAGQYVRVFRNGEPKRVDVTTGLKADMGRVEIITGLVEGDEVVIRELDV